MKNVISQSLGLDLVNVNVNAKVYQNIPLSSRDRAIFTFSEFGARQILRPMISVILQFLELDLVNINVSAKFYQNVIWLSHRLHHVNINMYAKVYQSIPLSSRHRALFTFFQNLALGKVATNYKCHFAISWTRCRQYQRVCKFLSKYSKRFRVIDSFHEQSGDKIFTNCPVTKSNVWL